jgi:hypothetical protein
MTNLHGEVRDLAATCFWVGAFLQRFNDNNINKRSNQQQEQTIRISEDGYTPEETLHMLFAAQQQQDEYQYPSNNNNNNNHSQRRDEKPEKYGGSSPPLFLVESLQELQVQCQEYVQAHSQPGAPRIINARSRLRRRQRLIERPMTLLLSSSSSSSSSTADPFSSSSQYGAIQETNDNNDIGNPKELEEEEEELFYGIVKDDVHQRIVLVFHETPTMMRTMQSTASWQDLLHVHQVPVPLPSTLQGKVPRDPTGSSTTNNNNNTTTTTSLEFVDSIGLRADLYHFLFSNKSDCSNGSNNNVSDSRYQSLLTALQHVLRAHPSYTFHVTGFYGGAAACAVLVAFFLAAEPQAVLYNHVLFTTNPIVNCLAFACPRVGDSQFLQACQYLERGEPQQRQKRTVDDAEHFGGDDCHNYSSPLLRLGRIVVVQDGNNDASAQIPMWNFSHVGFQIRLYQNDKGCSSSRAPEISYPRLMDHWTNRWNRTWGNAISIPSIWILLHQHSQDARAAAANAAAANYRLAIQQAQGHLQEYKGGMTSLYCRDKDGSNAWTGF